YVVDPAASQIVAYDTNTWQPRFRVDIGEDVSSYFDEASALGNAEMALSSDSRHLFLATRSGVREIDLPPPTGQAAAFGLTGLPSLLRVGDPATFTVTVLDPAHNPVGGFTGTVHLSSDDPNAVFLDPATGQALPDNSYTFRPEDQGSKTLQVVLTTSGSRSLI